MPASVMLIVAMVLGGVVGLAPTADAQAPRQLVLIASDSWVQRGEAFEFDLQLIGDSANANLDIVIYPPVTSREQLHDGLNNFNRRSTGGEVDKGSIDLSRYETMPNRYHLMIDALPDTRPRATGTGGLPVIQPARPGVYEIELRLHRSGVIEDRMLLHAVVLPPGDPSAGPPLATAMIVSFGAPPSLQADGTTEMSRDSLSQLEGVADALTSVPGVPATLDVRPETVEGLAALRTDRANELLDRLRLSVQDREILAAPFVALDIERWLAAGAGSDVTDQLGQGVAALTDALGEPPQVGVWLADQDVQNESITYLVSLGYDRGLILPEASVDLGRSGGSVPSDGQRFEIVDSNGVGQPAFLADAGVQAHFDRTGSDLENAHALLADLSFIALTDRDFARGIVIQSPEGIAPRRGFIEHVLTGLEDSPLFEPMTASALLDYVSPAMLASDSPDGPPIQRNLNAHNVDPISLTRLRGEAQSELVSIANILPEQFDTTPLLRRLLLVSASSELTETQQETYLRTIIERIRLDTDAISATVPDRVTLSSRDGIVPITIRNVGNADLQILVSLASDKLSFPDGARFELTVPPGVTELDLRVQARTSGDAALDLALLSPDRGIQLEATRVIVRSTALSGVGVIIAAVALAFLFVWWFRNLRSGRADKRLVGKPNLDLL